MTRREGYIDETVTKIELQYGVSSGAQLQSIGRDLVPVFEEHAVRIESGFGLETWGSMAVEEKAFLVAHRRIRLSLRNLQGEAEIKEAERKAKRNTPRKR